MKNLVVSFLSLCILLFLNSCTNTPDDVLSDYQELKAKEEKPFVINSINSKEKQVLDYDSGTEIVIPANAFVTRTGNEPEGIVKITFSEFHSYSDIYTSGIPMSIKEGSNVGQMVSAGMFEISAKDESGNELKLNTDKELEIKLACHTTEINYDEFFLESETIKVNSASLLQIGSSSVSRDSRKVRWKRTKKASIVKRSNFDSEIYKIEESKPDKPIKPVSNDDPNRIFFDLGVDIKRFKSLSGFQSIIWTTASDTIGTKFLQKKWDDIEIVNSGEGYYLLNLSGKNSNLVVPVVPMLDGDELNDALEEFDLANEDYKKESKRWKNRRTAGIYARKYVANMSVSQLGAHNIDFVQLLASSFVSFTPVFTSSGRILDIKEVILVSSFGGGKSVLTYDESNLDKFFFIPLFSNGLVVKTTDGSLYSINSEDFKAMNLSYKKPSMELQKSSVSVVNKRTLEELFNTVNPVM